MRRNTNGFALIELLIVVVIIGILAGIAIPKFAATKERAYVASMKTDLRNMATADAAYAVSHAGKYIAPKDAAALASLNVQLSTGNTMVAGTSVDPSATTVPGWSGTIQNANSGKKCYIFLGGATNPAPATVTMREGVPACDP